MSLESRLTRNIAQVALAIGLAAGTPAVIKAGDIEAPKPCAYSSELKVYDSNPDLIELLSIKQQVADYINPDFDPVFFKQVISNPGEYGYNSSYRKSRLECPNPAYVTQIREVENYTIYKSDYLSPALKYEIGKTVTGISYRFVEIWATESGVSQEDKLTSYLSDDQLRVLADKVIVQSVDKWTVFHSRSDYDNRLSYEDNRASVYQQFRARAGGQIAVMEFYRN